MGFMNSRAIIVHGRWPEHLKLAHAEAERICPGLVSSIVPARINCGGSFLVGPDGSKEGWEESDTADREYAALVAWLKKQTFADGSTPLPWALVELGEDVGTATVVASNHRNQEEPCP